MLDESVTLVERVLQQVRELSLGLRPSLLDDLGLAAALRWFVDRQAQRAGWTGHVDAEGLDLHPGMLEVLRKKAAASGVTAQVEVADMRDFTMVRRYGLVTIPFRGFMHLLTTEDQLKALRCMREHLEAGGALVFNLFYPSFERMVEPGDHERIEREFPHPETGLPVVLVTVKREYDRVRQVLRAEMEVRESDARGYAVAAHKHRFSLRWTYRFEMELLLRSAGFTRYEVAGGFDGRPLVNDTDEMVWTAWKD